MKTTVIVNIPMTTTVHRTNYHNDRSMLDCSSREVYFPVSAFLEAVMKPEDEIRCLLVQKESELSRHEEYGKRFRDELNSINEDIKARISYEIVSSPFAEDHKTHELLMLELVRRIEKESHVILDMTFGPKDLPIVEFSALSFAERYFDCTIDYLIYGQGMFDEKGAFMNATLCDLSPLYSLNTTTQTIDCGDPDKALSMLETLANM